MLIIVIIVSCLKYRQNKQILFVLTFRCKKVWVNEANSFDIFPKIHIYVFAVIFYMYCINMYVYWHAFLIFNTNSNEQVFLLRIFVQFGTIFVQISIRTNIMLHFIVKNISKYVNLIKLHLPLLTYIWNIFRRCRHTQYDIFHLCTLCTWKKKTFKINVYKILCTLQ